MQQGWYNRSFEATLPNGTEISVNVNRFLCMDLDEAGVINYEITPLNKDAKITYKPYIDAGVHNEDANWEEKFWEPLDVKHAANAAFVTARTFKTHFTATTFMQIDILKNGSPLNLNPENVSTDKEKVQFKYTVDVAKGDISSIHKIGGYTVLDEPRKYLCCGAKCHRFGFAKRLRTIV
jgi:maltose phosphorylase